MDNNKDLIKVKEDAIKIQESDIIDAIKSIEMENTKSYYAIAFLGVLIGIVFNNIDKIKKEIAIIFMLLTLVAIIIAFYNIAAKKIKIHTNVDDIFIKNYPNDWNSYLNDKHLRLRKIYDESKNLLYQKAILNKWVLFILILATLFLSAGRIFYGK